jgi:uncharacterized membrane protein YfcA
VPELPFDLTPLTIALVVGAALIIGISKTSVGGIGAVSVAAFAAAMPAKLSTAAVLLLLIIGDVVAVRTYHRHADWGMLKRLLPSVIPGVVLGAIFLNYVSDAVLRYAIGGMLLVMLGLQLWQRRQQKPDDGAAPIPMAFTVGTGVAAGFTTMTANAAGPVMAIYLLAARVDKARFIGTGAWYFLLVNLSKTPFSAALGLFPPSTLWLTLLLAPVVLLGTYLGRLLIKAISQQRFEQATILASFVGAITLLIPR